MRRHPASGCVKPFRARRKSTIRRRDCVETPASRSSLATRSASKSENEYFRSVPVPLASAYRLSVEQGQAVLLSDAIQNLAEIWGMDNADLLGVAMAHEI